MALKTIKQKDSALTNHQTYFPDYGWNFVKAGTETDTTHYARVNPLFQVWFGFFFSCPFAYGAPGQRLIIAHNAMTSWNSSLTQNSHVKSIIAQHKKSRYLPRLENEKSSSKSTDSKWPEIQPKARFKLFAEFSFHTLWNWGSAVKGKLRNWFYPVTFAQWEHSLCWAMLCCAASPLLLPPQQSTAKVAPGLCCERRDEWRLPSVICAALGEGSSGCTHRGAQESLCLELKKKARKEKENKNTFGECWDVFSKACALSSGFL